MSISYERFNFHSSLYPISICDVVANGDIDIANAADLQREIIWAIEESPRHSVLVDMSGVAFLGAAGINAFMASHRRALALDKKLLLVNVPTAVKRLFELTLVSRELSIRSFA